MKVPPTRMVMKPHHPISVTRPPNFRNRFLKMRMVLLCQRNALANRRQWNQRMRLKKTLRITLIKLWYVCWLTKFPSAHILIIGFHSLGYQYFNLVNIHWPMYIPRCYDPISRFVCQLLCWLHLCFGLMSCDLTSYLCFTCLSRFLVYLMLGHIDMVKNRKKICFSCTNNIVFDCKLVKSYKALGLTKSKVLVDKIDT